MLIWFSPRVRNTFAATPGWLRMPAPTIETLPTSSSAETLPTCSGSSTSVAERRSSRATVNERSALWSAETGSFWMIMSTFTFASESALNTRPATPGSSERPVRVTRAS